MVGAFAVVQSSAAAAASGPDSHTQPMVDGCQRSNAMDLTLTTPEWVYVNRSDVLAARLAGDQTAGRQTVDGVVSDIHPAGDDLYVNHNYNDIDIAVIPDPGSSGANLVATGNGGDLGTEWEGTLIPTWAWPAVGDRVRESGSWIWDCGHWGNGPVDETGLSELLPYDPEESLKDFASPGAISGEQTELHPLYQVATWRKDAAGVLQGVSGGRNLQRLDVWINGDGGPALSEEECALFGAGSVGSAIPQVCSRNRDVGGTYSYTLDHLGPRAGRMIVNPIFIHPETDPALRNLPITVTKNQAAGTVTVTFTLPHQPVPQHFGITVEAGYSNAPAAVHHVVTLNSITINGTLDGSTEPNINPITSPTQQTGNPVLHEQTPDPGEWVLYAQVNGQWRQLDPSKLSAVTTNEQIPLGQTFDYWLPAGVAPTLYVSGRECDIPYIDCRSERYNAPPEDPQHVFTELGFNDKPGRIELGNTGLPLTPGQAVYEPIVNPVPTSSNEDYSDASCGGPCYSLTATAS